MEPQPIDVHRVAAVRAGEVAGADLLGVPMMTLMERAGRAAFADLAARYPAARRLLVLCGPGNNGGDGYVCARAAIEAGWQVTVCAPGGAPSAPSDGYEAWRAYASQARTEPFVPPRLADCDLVVDALFGSGLTRALEAPYADVVRCINAAGCPVYAIDVPSGLDADNGATPGVAVMATRTLALGALKPGYYLGHGPAHCGELAYASLGLPAQAFAAQPLLTRLTTTDCLAALPRRGRLAHKGTHGHVVIIAGGPGMAGAARLAGLAALRAGAGLVTVACHADTVAMVAAGVPELICVAPADPLAYATLLARADIIAVGPGLGTTAWAGERVELALASGKPCVVDADALNWLARHPRALPAACLTPHPGEAVRLLAAGGRYADTAALQADRDGAAMALAVAYRAVIVLKGAATLVAVPGEVTAVCDRGNPGMATAGSGDVLTGVIAALAAQQPDRATDPARALRRAARAGVLVHAQAGDRAAQAGERGLIASDLIGQLRGLVNPAHGP